MNEKIFQVISRSVDLGAILTAGAGLSQMYQGYQERNELLVKNGTFLFAAGAFYLMGKMNSRLEKKEENLVSPLEKNLETTPPFLHGSGLPYDRIYVYKEQCTPPVRGDIHYSADISCTKIGPNVERWDRVSVFAYSELAKILLVIIMKHRQGYHDDPQHRLPYIHLVYTPPYDSVNGSNSSILRTQSLCEEEMRKFETLFYEKLKEVVEKT